MKFDLGTQMKVMLLIAVVLGMGCTHVCPEPKRIPSKSFLKAGAHNPIELQRAVQEMLDAHCGCEFPPDLMVLDMGSLEKNDSARPIGENKDLPGLCMGSARMGRVYGVIGGIEALIDLYPMEWSVRKYNSSTWMYCKMIGESWVCEWPHISDSRPLIIF